MQRLVRYQLQGSSPNKPFANILPHVGSALDAHTRVQATYSAARVAAGATDPIFVMPVEPSSPREGSQARDSSHAAGGQGTGSQAQ